MRKTAAMFLLVTACTASMSPLHAQFVNIKIDSGNAYGECAITMNPKNTSEILAGSNLNNVYRSLNGGTTWTKTQLNNAGADNGDPTCAIDTNGNFYFAHLKSAQDGNSCYRSTDQGATWSFRNNFGTTTTKDLDKEWLYVDWAPNSPYINTLYSTWAEFDNYSSSSPLDSGIILLSKSSDGGLNWAPSVRVSKQAGNCGFNAIKGSVLASGPSGELYVAWCGNGVSFQKSLDGGATWMMQDKIVDTQVPTWYFTVPGFTYGTGFPGIACDVSGLTYNGNIYITWCDQRNGTNNTDVFVAKSSDGGTNWTTTRVNNDIGLKHQSHPWIAVDQVTGYVYVDFYDRRNYSNNATEVWLAWSTDGGASYQNIRVSNSPSFTPGNQWTDYIGLTAHNNKVHPIWSGSTSGVDTWTTTINYSQLVGLTEQQDNPDGIVLYQNYPNPFNMVSHFDFTLPKASEVTLRIYDMLGKEVSTLMISERYDAGTHHFSIDNDALGLKAGIYYCVLSTPDARDTRKFTVTE
jgi:hypothetical protein